MDGGVSVSEIFEHRTELFSTVAYSIYVAFGLSPDGTSPAFNASAKIYEDSIAWEQVSGSTVHTKLWAEKVQAIYGNPMIGQPHRLTLLGTKRANWEALEGIGPDPRPRPLQPSSVPSTMIFEAHGPMLLGLQPTGRFPALVGEANPFMEQLTAQVVGADAVDEVVVEPGAAARVEEVESITLRDPVALNCATPFNWRPPLVFPPLQGGQRVPGWFVVEAPFKDLAPEPGGLHMALHMRPSSRAEDISLPDHWQAIGLAGVFAVERHEILPRGYLQKARKTPQFIEEEEEESEEESEESEEEEESEEGEEEGEFFFDDKGKKRQWGTAKFVGAVTHPVTGVPLSICPRGFSFVRRSQKFPENNPPPTEQDALFNVGDRW
jgi:hypothetical protein